MSYSPYIIGVTGRSGSGKTTFVRNIQRHFGNDVVTIHTMDNYYSSEQLIDEVGYKNFDLPTSFDRARFCNDLGTLISGKDLLIPKYEFKLEGGSHDIHIPTAPVIIVEGLFIYYYDAVMSALNYKVMVHLNMEEAYHRRLKRDQAERNYSEEVTSYRYFNHVEPSYKKFIAPYLDKMDLLVDNSNSLREGELHLRQKIDAVLAHSV